MEVTKTYSKRATKKATPNSQPGLFSLNNVAFFFCAQREMKVVPKMHEKGVGRHWLLVGMQLCIDQHGNKANMEKVWSQGKKKQINRDWPWRGAMK